MRHVTLFIILVLLAACSKDEMGENKYSNRSAHFRMDNVVSAQPLFAACNNPGVWCRATVEGQRYRFDSYGMTTAYTIIPAASGERMVPGTGLIIGTPSIPEPGATATIVTCYDLLCPTCYNAPLDKPLAVYQNREAQCDKCKCRYDLNNQGLLIDGPEGAAARLFRYRVSYLSANNLLLVSN